MIKRTGAEILNFIENESLNVYQIALASDIRVGTVYKILRGETPKPRQPTLDIIKSAFNKKLIEVESNYHLAKLKRDTEGVYFDFEPVNKEDPEAEERMAFMRDDPDLGEEAIQIIRDQLGKYTPGQRDSLFKILDLLEETPPEKRDEILRAVDAIVRVSRGK